MTDITTPSGVELLTPSAAMMLKNLPAMVQLADAGVLGYDQTGIFVFQGTNNNKPFRNVEGTGMCSVVVSSWQDAGNRSRFSSAHPMILEVLVFSDESRGISNSVVAHDSQSKAYKVYSIFDPIFHDNKNISKNWWGLEILESSYNSGPNLYPVDGEDGLYVLQATYRVVVY